MKKIITHINPDLDAVASVWLLKRFLPGWENAEIGFVEATASGEKVPGVDETSEILYVDVGRGKLDHHQTGEYLSTAKLCFDYILGMRKNRPLSPLGQTALEKMVEVVTQIDNAADLKWEEITLTRYQFYLHILSEGLRQLGETDTQVMEFGFRALDAALLNLKNKIRAEEELKNGIEFQTYWGKGIAVESGNKHVVWVGEVSGYAVVVKKNPQKGGVQIYCRPDSKANLSEACKKFKEMDPESDWFLHASGKLLLNESSVNPNMRPTKLTFKQIIEVLKS